MNPRNVNRIRIVLVLFLCSAMVLAGCGNTINGGGGTLMGGALQGKTLTLTGAVSTLAGRADFNPDGARASAIFNSPFGITTDGTSLYVADRYNQTIRKAVIATGAVTTLAGSTGSSGSADGTGTAARFNEPVAITTDGTNLYVADSLNHTIRKVVIASGAVTTLAGSAGSSGATDGTGTEARFYYPYGIATDGTNLYVSDGGNTIRKVVIATGAVTTLAGSAGSSGATDGAGAAARFNNPNGIAIDGTNLYVADSDNNTIRQVVIATGAVTTLAGSAGVRGSSDSTDGAGATARFSFPFGITTDGTNLYVADSADKTIRKVVIATGAVTTLAGSAGLSGATDSAGAAARFVSPQGIAIAGTDLYVTDCDRYILFGPDGFSTIRKVEIATAAVTTPAGGARPGGSTDGTGAAARFYNPRVVTTDGSNLYVTDSENHTIRQVVIATGAVTTLAGSAGSSGSADGTGAAARFNQPRGITTDGTNLYVADRNNHIIRNVVIATGAVTTLAGSAGSSGATDGMSAAARFNSPYGITTDGTNLYVTDSYNHTIRKVVIATGAVTTLAGSAGSRGATDGNGAAALFNTPNGITTDGTNLYVADFGNHTIRRVVIATGAATTLAGSAGSSGATDGTGPAARFDYPNGMTTDGSNLYLTDSDNHTIRKVETATGAVTTLAGSAGLKGATDGNGSVARFTYPNGITTDGTNLYIVDTYNNTIRTMQ
jgi:sugar lactone lactonase YvrE/predicted small secreted protein